MYMNSDYPSSIVPGADLVLGVIVVTFSLHKARKLIEIL